MPDGAYVAPSYVDERQHGEVEWKRVCSLCGAVVRNAGVHSEWHAALWVALSRTVPGADQ